MIKQEIRDTAYKLGMLTTLVFIIVLALAYYFVFKDYNCNELTPYGQEFFLKHGGPEQDPYRLDGDKDGIACEA